MRTRLVVPTTLATVALVLGGCEPTAPAKEATASPSVTAGGQPTPAPDASGGTAGGSPSASPPSAPPRTTGPTRSPGPSASPGRPATGGTGGPVADPGAVGTTDTANGRLYAVPGLSADEADRAYRYVAIVTGSEPGANGHPGLDAATRRVVLAELPTIVARVSTDHGGRGLVPANGTVSTFEAYTAAALGSTLYRPYYAANAGIDDDYGRNWRENLTQLVRARGGISRDTLQMVLDRVADGQPIARNQNGARERFTGAGAQFQPYDLRNDKTFSRAPGRLQDVLDSPMD